MRFQFGVKGGVIDGEIEGRDCDKVVCAGSGEPGGE